MERLRVDPTKCQAYGTCAEVAPDLFQLDPWGYAQARRRDLTDGEAASAEAAIKICPVKAIRLLG
ncbi:ferredoxin [Pseudonocardia acidicola]|uniref:Ferredoxin n=1 Tax=Pseudonocardia acidicola TaxID=2724939 RepID=A0ABX1SJZ8_9PSEU|nr:ferredoxin [Pseudonocardia acidicola]NMI01871.1 ferredoxin [Pseudonocardia acidicola]